MRCQASIWRWSPFLGICASKLMAASGCTTKGANIVVSAAGWPAISFCQCACGPSPRQEMMPMPVIQASRASAIGTGLEAKSDPDRVFAHLHFHFCIGEIEHAHRQGGIADFFAVAENLG